MRRPLSLILGFFLLFLSLKPLVSADNEIENLRSSVSEMKQELENNRSATIKLEKIRKSTKERLTETEGEKKRNAKVEAERQRIAKAEAERQRIAKAEAEKERLAKIKVKKELIAKAEAKRKIEQDRAEQKKLDIQIEIKATQQWSPSQYCLDLLKNCSGRAYGKVCINVRYVNDVSTCQGNCAKNVRSKLKKLGFDVNWGRMDLAPGPDACVGFRPDLDGNSEGAECLARILGPEYRVGACHGDGYPYIVYLH